jgi:hypothetical protein
VNAGVRIAGFGSLSLDFVPGEEETAGDVVIVGARARKLECTLEEGLIVATLLLGCHAAEDVHLVLDQASTVSVSLLRSLSSELSLGKHRSIQCLLGRISQLKPIDRALRAKVYYLLLF